MSTTDADGSPPGEDPAGGDGDSLSLTDIFPELADSAKEFLKDPKGWLVGVVVGWLLGIWEAFLELMNKFWSELADIPQKAIYEPVATAFAGPGGAIQDVYGDIGDLAFEVADVAGPLSPIVVVGLWLVPALLTVSMLYFLWGFVETYLPVEGIPVLRRIS